MLKTLFIKNYALIQHIDMHFTQRSNAITGETGAGKSILVGALSLLMGQKNPSKYFLDSTKKCVVEGTFDVSKYKLQDFFSTHNLEDDATLLVRREISPQGKSRAFLNDTPIPLHSLQALGARLVDIHSQHDKTRLMHAAFQLQALDHWAGLSKLFAHYHHAYRTWQDMKKARTTLENTLQQQQQQQDYRNFLLQELQEAQLEAQEQSTWEQQLQALEHAQSTQETLEALCILLEDSEHALVKQLHTLRRHLETLASIQASYQELAGRAESAYIDMKDLLDSIRQQSQFVKQDPQRIEEINERLTLIYTLQRKHKVQNIPELLTIQRRLRAQTSSLETQEQKLQQLKQNENDLQKELQALAEELSAKRQEAFEPFCEQVETLMRGLGMPDGRVSIQHQTKTLDKDGINDITFLFSANKGIAPKALKHVASGGELSRLMFIMKYLLATKHAMPTLLFDEIDAGISGHIGQLMNTMIQEMALKHQVIIITHAPALAAATQSHFLVFKDMHDKRTTTQIKLLEAQERLHEVAKMIGGREPSAPTLQAAQDMMQGHDTRLEKP